MQLCLELEKKATSKHVWQDPPPPSDRGDIIMTRPIIETIIGSQLFFVLYYKHYDSCF